ncbi:hypothetical protein EZS27_017172 [termite gut metagenome]|uniref:Glycosyl transferase family 25 domain-containing protein n=1 Tax=termite gut metagenome TaxID=433724 RepID=A0A5J4RN02_9ZZZZ
MKVYIINLKSSMDRRQYMYDILKPFSAFDIQFVDGIDGRLLSDKERDDLFDLKDSFKRYGRECNPGEQGCTLSHLKCYDMLIKSRENYALIFEDDIVVDKEETISIIEQLEPFINIEEPTVILLSGGYWYYRKDKIIAFDYKLASVYDAYFTHAYLINKAAAQILKEEKPSFLADDWYYIKSKGIQLKAVKPHLVNQKGDETFQSLIYIGNSSVVKRNLSFLNKMRAYLQGGIKKVLTFISYYEDV